MSLLTEPIEHKVPAGSQIVVPSLCSNCTRTLYRVKGKKILCHDCGAVSDPDAQIWECESCRTGRKWGEGRPDTTKEKKLLGCIRCGEPTLHRFSHVA